MADIENKNNNIKPDSYPQYSNIKGLDFGNFIDPKNVVAINSSMQQDTYLTMQNNEDERENIYNKNSQELGYV